MSAERVKDVTATSTNVCKKHFRLHFSIIVQWICVKFGVVIEPNSACFSLLLGDWSFFSFGVDSVLVSRFVSPFKCTVDKKL